MVATPLRWADEARAAILPTENRPERWLHLYTNLVMAAGGLVLVGVAPRAMQADPVWLGGLVALAILTSLFKLDLRLSQDSATMTLGYAVGFLGLVSVGPHATAIAVAAGIWTQCTYRLERRTPMDLRRRLFSVACGVLTVEAAGLTFASLGGTPGSPVAHPLAAPLAGAALAYFLANTGLVAGAIALATGQRVADVWQRDFLLSGPSYFISAAIVGGGAVVIDRSGFLTAILVTTPFLLTFLGYRAYLRRIGDEQEKLRVARQHKGLDVLTGLPNRLLLHDAIERAIDRCRRASHSRFAVLFIDFDGFKQVNDVLGHQAGDELLQAAAGRLQGLLRRADLFPRPSHLPRPPGDLLARLGGDEFVILLDEVQGQSEAMHVAQLVQALFGQPFDLSGRRAVVSASVGVALGSADCAGPEDILREADLAMYRAKSLGKSRAELFDTSLHQQVQSRQQLDSELRLAVERCEFLPYYQPIVNLVTGELAGFEALLRWQHPSRGVIASSEFISVLEAEGLIMPVGRRFFAEVCRQLGEWQSARPSGPELSVNINFAAQQVLDPEFLQSLLRLIDDAGLEPGQIVLEITESAAMQDYARTITALERAREAGLRIVLDDFGTGYSSLSCLHELPISGIKLDRSFLSRTRRQPAILSAIVTLAGQLGLTVTAEGVETAAQCAQLAQLGCELGQGYQFARPMSADRATLLLGRPSTWLPPPRQAAAVPAPVGRPDVPAEGADLAALAPARAELFQVPTQTIQ
ncbi:MAG: EAL domain-containing protein [Vicinamibacterales bacterium]